MCAVSFYFVSFLLPFFAMASIIIKISQILFINLIFNLLGIWEQDFAMALELWSFYCIPICGIFVLCNRQRLVFLLQHLYDHLVDYDDFSINLWLAYGLQCLYRINRPYKTWRSCTFKSKLISGLILILIIFLLIRLEPCNR